MQKDDILRTSLIWLILHELCHYEMDHFRVAGQRGDRARHEIRRFGLVCRTPAPNAYFNTVTDTDHSLVRPCLELQADHEAIDYVLGDGENHDPAELRLRAAAIFGVMVLIDRADCRVAGGHCSHPSTTARVFQLLGHLIQLPLIRRRIGANPDGLSATTQQGALAHEICQTYRTETILHVLFDAIEIASVTGAKKIAADLSDPAGFIADIGTAMTKGVSAEAQYRTDGAREWATLALVNERIRVELGWSV
ncbi:hypothetical protein AADZ90_021845 [Aestuariibius sp. 2305UL40-4]|uniref:hypothetical protein n=1 Tax=Aestuariibius violaceus TaxID=3234132 RepID=UPI00398F7969